MSGVLYVFLSPLWLTCLMSSGYGGCRASIVMRPRPHGLSVLHGKTRRGGLVFDVADLVKDAIILPQAFISATRGDDEQQFRQACIEGLTRLEALDFMIESLKSVVVELGVSSK